MDVLRDIQANPTDTKAMDQLVKQVSALEAASKISAATAATAAPTTKTLTPPMLPADDVDTEMDTDSDKPYVTPLSPPKYEGRVILTTYPGQSGVNPIPLRWGAEDPKVRGPIVVARDQSSFKQRNAIGAHH